MGFYPVTLGSLVYNIGRLTFVISPEPNKELFKLHRSDSPDNR